MALQADGSGDFAIRTAGGFIAPTALTVCFWAMLENDRDASSAVFGLRDSGGDGTGYTYYYNPSGDGVTFGWEHQQTGGAVANLDLTALTPGVWYFIALVRSGLGANQAVAYRRSEAEGALTDSIGTFDANVTANEEIVLANGFATAGSWFPGRIAHLRQWAAALSESELLDESLSETVVRTVDLHSDRPFVGVNVAAAVLDVSGNGRDLTANGSLNVVDGPELDAGGDTIELDGTITPAGALVLSVTKSLSGSITPAGAMAKTVQKSFTGSVALSGAIAKTVARVLAGAVTPAGSLAKSILKVFSGSITPAGAISTLKVILLELAGSITPAGALSRMITKGLSGSITPAGAIRKTITKLFSGVVTIAGALVNFVAGSEAPVTTVTATSERLTTVTATSESGE